MNIGGQRWAALKLYPAALLRLRSPVVPLEGKWPLMAMPVVLVPMYKPWALGLGEERWPPP